MNGQFPHDVFLIVFGPFVMIATYVWLTPLLMPDHVHHRLAVIVAIIVAVGLACAVLLFWLRRRRRKT